MSTQAKPSASAASASAARRPTPSSSTTASAASTAKRSSPSPTSSSSPPPPSSTSSNQFNSNQNSSLSLAATQIMNSGNNNNSNNNSMLYEEVDSSGVHIKRKLEGLSTRFDGFEDELNLSRNKKKQEEDKRILILQTQLNNLQSSLALESKNRAMSVKALQNWLTDRISQWTEQIEAPMSSRLNNLSDSIQLLTNRIDQLENQQNQDRIIFPKLVDGRCEELLREISDLKLKFESNLLSRDEKEKKILLKLQNESNKLAVQFQQDKTITDEKIKSIRQSIDEEVNMRTKAHEGVKTTLLEEVSLIKSEINKEKKERETADEDLVSAINHYAAALQDGIRVVSTQ